MNNENCYNGGSCGNNNDCPPQPPMNNGDIFSSGPSGKIRGVAGLLAIFLGSFGVQYFYLGKTTAGIITILVTWLLCGIPSIVWLIQGIMMMCMNQADFERKYVYSTSTYPLF